MSLPATPQVVLRLGVGAGFGDPLILGSSSDGILGTNVLAASPATSVDITSQVLSISTRRGRDRVADRYNNGTATVRFLDTTGDFDPSNASGPYYGEIAPMRRIRITASYGGNSYYLFSGYITEWDFDYEPGWDGTVVTISAQDGFRLLNLAQITTVSGSAVQDLPGERIGYLLTSAGWPNGLRSLDTGAVELLADPGTARSALSAVQTVESTEEGALFCSPSGTIVFTDRAGLATQAAQSPTVFDDDGTDIAYQEIEFALDDTELANDITIGSTSGTPQQVEDSASITEFFRRSYSDTSLLFYDDSDALGKAQRMLAYRKGVDLRISSITLDNSSDSDRVLASLSLSLNDPIEVHKTNAGGVRVDASLLIQGIDHDITPGVWRTRFSTALPPS